MKRHLAQELRLTCLALAACFVALAGQAFCQADEPSQPKTFPGEKTAWHGYDRYDFEVDGRGAIVVTPKKVAPGKPWIWRARFFGDPPAADPALLSKGFHLVYIDVVDLFGNPQAMGHWDAFYKFLTEKHGLARKLALEGFSRGGLIVYNWAAANPDKVACIYADAPVCDIKSWPGGLGKGSGNTRSWPLCLKAWNLTPEEALTFKDNPIDHLEPIAKAGVPLLHVCGGADRGVPLDENTRVLEQRYKKLGGKIQVIVKPNCGHNPHSLKDPTPIVEFILKHTGHGDSKSSGTTGNAETGEKADVPGVIVDHSPAGTRTYIGNPSIVILPNGHYVASHDAYGPGHPYSQVYLFRSRDAGATWQPLAANLRGQYESTLFVHQEALYLLGGGITKSGAFVAIRRSTDGGETWTVPLDGSTGRLVTGGNYNAGATPVVVHNGRIWRAMEEVDPAVARGTSTNFRSLVVSAPVDADLLDASNWTLSNSLLLDDHIPGLGWLEGNVVTAPGDKLVVMLRVARRYEEAAVIRISENGKTLTFDPENGLVRFPGGTSKFTIRYDAKTKRYWSLVNKREKPTAVRNVLALTSSADLIHWSVESVILEHPDGERVGFQYVDWQFEGHDIIAVSRTACNGADNFHDANYLTFHRIRNFRDPRGTSAN